MSTRSRIVLLTICAALTLVLALVLILILGSGSSSHSPSNILSTTTNTEGHAANPGESSVSGFDGAALPAGVRAQPFTLTALSTPTSVPVPVLTGQPAGPSVSLSAFRGQVVVIAFLYSTCGSTCTLIAQQIRGALNELPHPPTVLIVSADPAADTRASVERFLSQVSLAGRVYYLTGSPAQLRAVWHAYRVTPASAGRAAFDAAATVYLVDPTGFERVEFGSEQLTPEGLAHDIGRLQTG
jgi:protein SCO1